MLIRGVIAVGCVRERKPVFEQQHLCRARGVGATNPYIWPQSKTLLITVIDAGDLSQRLRKIEYSGVLELLSGNPFDRPRNFVETLRRSRKIAGRHGNRCGYRCGAKNDSELVNPVRGDSHIPFNYAESVCRNRDTVVTWRKLRELEQSAQTRYGLPFVANIKSRERNTSA